MSPEELVNKIRLSIVERNTEIYRSEFSRELTTEQEKDTYWKDAMYLYSNLDTGQRETLFKIMRQVNVDTLSSVFAILDGVASLEDQPADFVLTLEGSDEPLNGELQDWFLSAEEEMDNV